MVTLNKDDTSVELSFKGLSTDTKPTGYYDDTEITNGSSFFCMDTQEVFFYDYETQAWLEQP